MGYFTLLFHNFALYLLPSNTLWQINIAIEHGHRNSEFSHSYVAVYQRVPGYLCLEQACHQSHPWQAIMTSGFIPRPKIHENPLEKQGTLKQETHLVTIWGGPKVPKLLES